MARSRLVLGLAAVFAGLTAVLTIAALVVQPFLLIIALPFAATTYFLWLHATGRLAAHARRTRTTTTHGSSGVDDQQRRRFTSEATDRTTTAGRRRSRVTDRSTAGRDGTSRRAGTGANDTHHGDWTRSSVEQPALSREEACRILGVSPDADQDAVKAAYRERVKGAHPDTAAGDEQAFKRLNRAYERLKRR